MGDTGHASVADFGIARALGQPVRSPERRSSARRYMSPEQWRGDELDGAPISTRLPWSPRELAGRRPSTARACRICSTSQQRAIPTCRGASGCRCRRAAAIRRAMAKHPSERFATATASSTRSPIGVRARLVQRASRPSPFRRAAAGLSPRALALATIASVRVRRSADTAAATELWTIARDRGIATEGSRRARCHLPPAPAESLAAPVSRASRGSTSIRSAGDRSAAGRAADPITGPRASRCGCH